MFYLGICTCDGGTIHCWRQRGNTANQQSILLPFMSRTPAGRVTYESYYYDFVKGIYYFLSNTDPLIIFCSTEIGALSIPSVPNDFANV